MISDDEVDGEERLLEVTYLLHFHSRIKDFKL